MSVCDKRGDVRVGGVVSSVKELRKERQKQMEISEYGKKKLEPEDRRGCPNF